MTLIVVVTTNSALKHITLQLIALPLLFGRGVTSTQGLLSHSAEALPAAAIEAAIVLHMNDVAPPLQQDGQHLLPVVNADASNEAADTCATKGFPSPPLPRLLQGVKCGVVRQPHQMAKACEIVLDEHAEGHG